MENWKVDDIHFERESISQGIETVTLRCTGVTFDPAPSIADQADAYSGLHIHGCEPGAISRLPWPPTRVRFKAHRYVEERLFEIGPLEVHGDDIVARLPASGTDVDTNSSDAHIGAFPSSDAHTHT